MDIQHIVNTIYPLSMQAALKLNAICREVSFPKGHILMHANKIESYIYFIKKGIARAYAYKEDTEITFWFGIEGETILSMKSYIENNKGYENIELLEDCVLYAFHGDDLQKLYETDLEIANWGRKFAEKELVKTEQRLINREFKTASERYQQLLRDYPHLIQRVALGNIASYLGITQVSLSRIRAEKK